MLVMFRADMNSQIATGHVMRCLSIADAVTKIGGETIFVSADDNPRELITSRGYTLISLGHKWDDLEQEIEDFSKVIDTYNPDVLLIDSYYVTYKYLDEINSCVNVYYIDDVNKFEYPVYGIISYGIYANKFNYGNHKRLLIGPTYAPLRKEFSGCEKKYISDKIDRILVMSGGTDQYGMIERIVDGLKMHDELQNDCVIRAIGGRLFDGIDRIINKYKEYSNIEILKSVDDMRSQLEWADLVITAGGSTTYEICAVGTPAITFSFADNQMDNVLEFDERRIFSYAGDARHDDVVGNIIHLLATYDRSIREEFSKREQSLIDGNGAERIAGALLYGSREL